MLEVCLKLNIRLGPSDASLQTLLTRSSLKFSNDLKEEVEVSWAEEKTFLNYVNMGTTCSPHTLNSVSLYYTYRGLFYEHGVRLSVVDMTKILPMSVQRALRKAEKYDTRAQ